MLAVVSSAIRTGQKAYHIPYPWKKLCAYIVIVVILYFIHAAITFFFKGNIINLTTATILILLYLWFLATVERKELLKISIIARFLPGRKGVEPV